MAICSVSRYLSVILLFVLTNADPNDEQKIQRSLIFSSRAQGISRQDGWMNMAEYNALKATQFQHVQSLRKSFDKRLNRGEGRYQDYLNVNTMGTISCDLCKFIVANLKDLVKQNKTDYEIVRFAIGICIDFKIEDARVCPMVVEQYKDMGLGTASRMLLSPDAACGLLTKGRCGTMPDPRMLWNLTLPDTPKPPVTPPVPPKVGSPRLRVLHLTDLHLDLQYLPGANPKCGEPLCCRDNDGPPNPGGAGAGPWGDYENCDVYRPLLDSLFLQLRDIKDQIDLVYFTGDIPAHDVWNQSRADQLTHLAIFMSYFNKYLPGVPVYSCPGNHESSPCNSYPPPFIKDDNSVGWLYGALSEAWSNWLPESAIETILRGGFYTFSPFTGFRIISLNFNFCHSDNWWLLVNSTDPADQLQWLMGVLQQAEDAGEKVHILGHHPPGECLQAFNWNYYRIVNRYESTITGQFFGHTHKDHFEVFYDDASLQRPTNVAYIGGSVTPYSYINPGFRIYEVDGNYKNSSWAVLDFTHYIVDLSKANNNSQPEWQKEYSPKESYGMNGLYPSDWNDLIYRMRDNDELFQTYYLYRFKSRYNGPCDESCKKEELCSLKSARVFTPQLCSDL